MKRKLLLFAVLASVYASFAQIAHYSFTNGAVTSSVGSSGTTAILSGATTTFGLDGSADNALTFGPNKLVDLPDQFLLRQNISVSLWFKSTARGAILGYQNSDVYTTASQYVPIVYLGADGKIYAGFWSGEKRNVNTLNTTYNDGKWHHLVLTSDANSQSLYLDNIFAGTMSYGHAILPGMVNCQLGTARTGGWANVGGADWFDFVGEIDEVRFYNTALDSDAANSVYELESPNIRRLEISEAELDFGEIEILSSQLDSFFLIAPLENTDSIEIEVLYNPLRTPECPIINGPPSTHFILDNFTVTVDSVELTPAYGVQFFPINDSEIGNVTVKLGPGDSAIVVIKASPETHQGQIIPDGFDAIDICDFGIHPSLSLGLQNDVITIQNLTEGSSPQQFDIKYTGVNEIDDENGETGGVDGILDFNSSNESSLSIYPNPATSIINTEEGLLEILDLTGNLVLSTDSNGQVDVSGLETGVYFVTQNGKKAKLIVE